MFLMAMSPSSTTVWPSSRSAVLDPGDPDGGRSHVHAAPAGAEVHGDAQDVDDHA